MKRIFISSVQKEFAKERKLLKRYIAKNPAYRRLFDTFVFEEDVVSTDRRADEVYLDELAKCQIYIGLIGDQYGFQDAGGISPTEREYDEATRLGLRRLIFVLGRDGASRQDEEAAFLRKISANLIRAKCDDPGALLLEIYASLDGLLMEQGAYRMGPFDASACEGASFDDIDEEKVAWFVRRARRFRNADIDEDMPIRSVLNHLKLIAGDAGEITNAAILLFGKHPQRFLLSSEVKCAQWYGVERHKPMLSYQIYKGTLFDMADDAVAFVLSKLNLRVGTRDKGTKVEREYEIPASAVAEAIINAIAHRDYSSSGSVQIELFADRLVIRNPGTINPAITKEELFEEHSSFPNNSLIADQLYQTKHIEKFGTGFTDLVNDCRAAGLRDPVVDDSKSDFTVTIYRPLLIAKAKEEQIRANKPQITNVKDADIIAIIQKYPELSISGLANKLQITGQMMRYRMDSLRRLGILRREGAKRNGRWVITSAFQGCGADGGVLINEQMPVAPELEVKLQKLADERGVPDSIVVSQILSEELSGVKHGEKDR